MVQTKLAHWFSLKRFFSVFVSFAAKWLHMKRRNDGSGDLQGSGNRWSQQQIFVLQRLRLAGDDTSAAGVFVLFSSVNAATS